MKNFLFALAFIASAVCASAQHELTLEQALHATLQHNPQLTGYKFRRAILDGEKAKARLRPETRLHVDAENVAGSGDFSGTDAAEFTLSFSSFIELGGQRDTRIGVVTARQAQLESERRVAILDLVAAVNYRFVSLLAAQEQVRLEQEARQLALELVESLTKRVQMGSTPEAELLRARAALVRTDIELTRAQQQAREQASLLSTFWNDSSPDFTRAQGDLYTLNQLQDFTYWQSRFTSNPDLVLLAQASRVRAAELRKAESEAKMALGWNAGVRQLQEGSDTAFVVGVSLPLASGQRAHGAIQIARAEQAAAELAEDSAKLQLATRLQQSHLAHQQALNEANSLRESILPLLRKATRATAKAFNQGRYSSLELAMAQRELLEARAELINAALRAHQTRIELERLTASAPSTFTEVSP